MKTNSHLAKTLPAPTPTANAPEFQALLKREKTTPGLPDRVEGLMTGMLCHLDDAGRAQVQLDHIQEGPFAAISTIALTQADVGVTRLVLGFQDGNPRKPIILGRVWTPAVATPAAAAPGAAQPEPRRKVVVDAQEELELRCGQAVIVLQADGRVQVRGRTITHQADTLHRIRAGAIQIN